MDDRLKGAKETLDNAWNEAIGALVEMGSAQAKHETVQRYSGQETVFSKQRERAEQRYLNWMRQVRFAQSVIDDFYAKTMGIDLNAEG